MKDLKNIEIFEETNKEGEPYVRFLFNGRNINDLSYNNLKKDVIEYSKALNEENKEYLKRVYGITEKDTILNNGIYVSGNDLHFVSPDEEKEKPFMIFRSKFGKENADIVTKAAINLVYKLKGLTLTINHNGTDKSIYSYDELNECDNLNLNKIK